MRWLTVALLATASCGFDWSLADAKDAGADAAGKGGSATGGAAGSGGVPSSGGSAGDTGAAGSGGSAGTCGESECIGKECGAEVICPSTQKAMCCLDFGQTCVTPTTPKLPGSFCVPSSCYDGAVAKVMCGSQTCPESLCQPFGLTCCDASDPSCQGASCCC